MPRAKDGGVPHAQVDIAAYWWDPASPMVCTARWALTSVLFGAHVAEISLKCPWPLAGSDMSSRAWAHRLWCTARLIQRARACVMCRWRLVSGEGPILKAWNRNQRHQQPTVTTQIYVHSQGHVSGTDAVHGRVHPLDTTYSMRNHSHCTVYTFIFVVTVDLRWQRWSPLCTTY